MKKRKKKLRSNWYVSCNTRSSSTWNCSPEPFLQCVVLEILFSSFAKLAKRNAHQKTYLGFFNLFFLPWKQWKNPHLRFSPRRLNSQVTRNTRWSWKNIIGNHEVLNLIVVVFSKGNGKRTGANVPL
jgi:hypothetical protein